MEFDCHVEVRALEGIADPAGRTIERALPALGFSGVRAVHVGKVISFVVEAPDEASCRVAVELMCERLLANPVIERAEVAVAPRDGASLERVSPTVGVVYFPGTNCEHDVAAAIRALGATARLIFHDATSLGECDAIVVPGGFAHGDYLRTGALARFSPVMGPLTDFASTGGPVLGICNGFQVLTEAGLLPGALMRNDSLRFICATVTCVIESTTSVLTCGATRGEELRLPINHYEGNYTCSPELLGELHRQGQIVLRYRDNPNGSLDSIAGVANRAGNVVGLMPHPERASDALLGSQDGNILLASFLEAAERFASRVPVAARSLS